MTDRSNHLTPVLGAFAKGFFLMKGFKWPIVGLALAAARIAVPVLAAIAAGARWDVALLAALGVEAGAGAVASRP